MARAGDVIDNPVSGQQLVFLATGSETDGERFEAEGIFPPGGFAGVVHVHPHQSEHFEVLAGRAEFQLEGEFRVLRAGATLDVPAGTKHTFSNAGPDEMRVRFEFRPGLLSTDRFYELYFGFAQEGRVNARALPGLLDIATIWPLTSEHAVLASPSAGLQHLLFGALGRVARLAGRKPPVCERTRRDGTVTGEVPIAHGASG